jgi:hypothetical protein
LIVRVVVVGRRLYQSWLVRAIDEPVTVYESSRA